MLCTGSSAITAGIKGCMGWFNGFKFDQKDWKMTNQSSQTPLIVSDPVLAK
jgi:hypothetical protein